jgi:hypothetical protein
VTSVDEHQVKSLAAEAYVYGYPLVADVMGAIMITDRGYGPMKPAPLNDFAHAVQLAEPEDKFVTVNNDTIYNIATVDLSGGPLVLHVPDTGGRYYVLQFVDAWSNNFAYVGKRATGTTAAKFLLTPQGWDGEVGEGMRRIDAPTRVFSIVGRIAVDGAEDLPAVHALQAKFTLRPLGEAGKLAGIPRPDGSLPEHLRFFDAMRLWIQAFPPPAAERDDAARFEPLGVFATDPPYGDVDADFSRALGHGLAAGKQKIEALSKAKPGGGGWNATRHMFDYNLDHLELGTIDDPEWKIGDRQEAIVMRAVAARAALWGNHAYEALYAFTYTDADGKQLNGADRYELRLEAPLPVDGFWSLTMYDMPDYYLVANPIGRYSIGDRTRGLRYDDDGSLTITIQHDEPADPTARANWLPAPAGDFRPGLRMYEPRAPLLDGSFALPTVTRVK